MLEGNGLLHGYYTLISLREENIHLETPAKKKPFSKFHYF